MERLLRYCKLEEFAADRGVTDTVGELYAAALSYLEEAGVQRSVENAARYDLAVDGMVLHWYETRQMEALPPGVRLVVNQLKPVRF